MSFPSWLTWALLPVYIVAGLQARAKSIRLAPAPGPLSGHIPGRGKQINLLVIGDSSVAGVGLDHTSNGLTYKFAQNLAQETGRPIRWRAVGNNSATSSQIRDVVVPNLEPEPFTHIFICIGFNDLKNFRSGRAWKKGFGELIYALRTRFPEARLYWPRIMPPHLMPSLPRVLCQVLEPRRQLVNRIGAQLCFERGAIALSVSKGISERDFCEDGVHASAAGNQLWADHMTAELLSENLLGLEEEDEVEDKQHQMNRAL